MGGKIEISSQFGIGSTFRFVIKAGTSEKTGRAAVDGNPSVKTSAVATRAKAPPKAERSLRIAVVEDNLISR